METKEYFEKVMLGFKNYLRCCEVSWKLILDFVEEIECNYGNRPALMRLLRSWFPLKSSRPSLPLKKAPPLFSVFFNGLYTPFGSPVCGGTETSGKKRKTALWCSEPLRSKVGGPSKVCAMFCGMGPPGNSSLQLIVYDWFRGYLLITYRFLAFSLVVSRKKRNFGGI